MWQVETLDGRVLESNDGEVPINPASVVKVTTSLWALETLGPDHRFPTEFRATGAVDAQGTLRGDLIVEGHGDPDFQFENAVQTAAELNRLGVRRISGALIVNDKFWIGWEGGSEGREPDPLRRGLMMAQRLRSALDAQRWPRGARRLWSDFALRRGLDLRHPPSVTVAGTVQVGEVAAGDPLLVHTSRPLIETLHRLNAYSNNDIERVGENLGTAQDLQRWLAQRWNVPATSIALQTTSGLGTNRIPPQLLVEALRDLRQTCERLGLTIAHVLPVSGCTPGTIANMFPHITAGPEGALVGKTGTLTATDGGVSVLAGSLATADGELLFTAAAPAAGGRIRRARARLEQWVLDLAGRHGGMVGRTCVAPVVDSGDDADVRQVNAPLTAAPPPPRTSAIGTAMRAATATRGH